MSILAGTRTSRVPGRWVLVPKDTSTPRRRRNRVVARRRQTFIRLLIASGFTLFFSMIPALHAIIVAHLAIDMALVVYIMQLRKWRGEHRPARASVATVEPIRTASNRVVQLDEPDRHIDLTDEGDFSITLPERGFAAASR